MVTAFFTDWSISDGKMNKKIKKKQLKPLFYPALPTPMDQEK